MTIEIELVDGISVVKMQSGENRFNGPFVAALAGALASAEAKKLPVVLTGDGKYFSNGLDLEWLGRDPGNFAALMGELHGLLGRLLVSGVPTAAAINGHAFGAGVMLAAACDYRVMRQDRGFLCFPEVDLGLTMSDGFNILLQSKFRKESLHQGWVSGERYGGEKAKELGFVHAVAADSDVLAAAAAWVRPLSGKDPQTLSALKRQLHERASVVLLGSG